MWMIGGRLHSTMRMGNRLTISMSTNKPLEINAESRNKNQRNHKVPMSESYPNKRNTYRLGKNQLIQSLIMRKKSHQVCLTMKRKRKRNNTNNHLSHQGIQDHRNRQGVILG